MHIQRRLPRLIFTLFCLTLVVAVASAQDHSLQVGATQSDTLNAEQLAHVYLLSSVGDEQIELLATNEMGANLALTLTDAFGNSLAQSSGEPGMTRLVTTIPAAGSYYVTVFSTGSGASDIIPFTITRLGTSTSADDESTTESGYPSTQVLTAGLEIDLNWDNTSNLDLEVRDPLGGSLYWLNPSVPSGGVLPANRNGSCEFLQSEQPERASWPAGILPSGSYEILVYYQEDCQGLGASDFTVDIRLNGSLQHSFAGGLDEGGVYIGRLVIRADGNSSLGLHGSYNDSQTLSLSEWNESAASIRPTETVAGTITNSDHARAYSFSAVAGDVVSLELLAIDGSLDTLLALYDPNGNLVATNDDIDDGTNSAIRLRALPVGGAYTVIASRYGRDLGGTEGNFNLTLSQQSSETASELAALNLPSGDVEVSLLWSTAADLQLLVRDPRGNSVYDDFPTTVYGASLALAGNVGCSSDLASPVSHIFWPSGSAIPGWYEVDIWYQDTCGDTTPVAFTLYITVRGQLLFSANVPIDPGQRYLTNFQLNLDGSVNMGSGGIFTGLQGLDYQSQIASAEEFVGGQGLGTILFEQPFQLYIFEGHAGDVVTVSMVASAGTLDTLLYLIDPNGIVLSENDDAISGETTDSLLSDIVLTQDGTYTVFATRYGIRYGGTEGPYQLSLLIR